VFAAGLLSQIAIYTWTPPGPPIRSDGISYYVYLPSVVLDRSPRLWAVADEQYGGAFPEYTGIKRWPNTSWWLNPHPIGVAVLMLPWFVVAHALTWWSNLPPDGFSLYYQMAASLSGLVYGVLGLWVLQRVLARAYPPGIVLATLVTLTFGTNLFHYLTFDATFSHAYGFMLMAALVAVTPRWLARPATGWCVALGLTLGLLVLVRHSHALFALVPLLHGVGATTSMRARLAHLWNARAAVLFTGAVATVLVLPQLALYFAVTGQWVVSPYALLPATLHFDARRLLDVFISPAKGLFFWSPVWLVALSGFAAREGPAAVWRLPALACLGLLAGLIASWYDWQFGGSFGHRGFTDALPLVAWPLAGALAWLWRGGLVRLAAGLAGAAVALHVFQMLQYWRGVVPYQDTTWDQYVSMFLRWTP